MKWNTSIKAVLMAAMICTIGLMAATAGATSSKANACSAPSFTQVKAPMLSDGNFAIGTDQTVTVRYRNCKVASRDFVILKYGTGIQRYYLDRILPSRNQVKKITIKDIGASGDQNGSVYRIHLVLMPLYCTDWLAALSNDGASAADFPEGCGPATWTSASSITVEKSGG